MSSFRLGEIKNQQKFQAQVFQQIDKFIRVADRYLTGKEHLSLDFDKNAETIQQLDFLAAEIQLYKERMIRASRYRKPKSEFERQNLRGPISALVGNRRIMIRKLDKLAKQIKWLKSQTNTFQPKGVNATRERTMQLVTQSIELDHGEPTMLPGQGIVVLIALLFSAFVEIKLGRSKSKNSADD